jgi:hypothetical protein
MNPSALFPREDFVAAIFGYFDESGKFKNNSVVSFAGVVASSSKAEQFGDDWAYWQRRFGVRCLSMKGALNHRRPLGTRERAIGSERRSAALMNFATCIAKHLELAIGFAIDVQAFKGLHSEARRLLGNDPHYTVFTRAISEMVRFVPDGRISVVCDDEEHFAGECLKLYRRLKRLNEPVGKRLVSICFVDDFAYPGIQAADMISALVRLEAQRQINGTDYEYQSLYNFLMTEVNSTERCTGIFGRQQLEAMAKEAMSMNKKMKGNAMPLAKEKS